MAKLVPLSTIELEIINYVEQLWHRSNRLPTTEEFEKEYPTVIWGILYQNNTFKLALQNRGIDPPPTLQENLKSQLTAHQFAAISLLTNFDDKRSRATKLRELGITPTRWSGWMKKPLFREYYLSIGKQSFEDAIGTAHEGLIKAMERGDTAAIKYYMEITDRYSETNSMIHNVKYMMAQLIECVQRHVKDPEALRAIAHDFKEIEAGRRVQDTITLEIGMGAQI